jgi:uncharacterized membrane protein
MIIPGQRGKTDTGRTPRRMAWAAAGLVLPALLLSTAGPRGLTALLTIAHAALYLGLLLLFGRSLLPGETPIATRLALRLHGALSPRRQRYTRAVTGLWVAYFALQIAACAALAAWPNVAALRWAIVLHLPLAAALLALELAFRAIWFRGQPHGSAADMLRALQGRHP